FDGRWHPFSVRGECNRRKTSQSSRSLRPLRSLRSTQARQNFPRTIAELLIVGDLFRVLLRFAAAREVVAGGGSVEPRGRHLPASLGDVLLAACDFSGLARRRIVG